MSHINSLRECARDVLALFQPLQLSTLAQRLNRCRAPTSLDRVHALLHELEDALGGLGDAVELPAVTGRESWRSAWVRLGRTGEGLPSVQAGLVLPSEDLPVRVETKVLWRSRTDEAHGKPAATPDTALAVLERRLCEALADVRALRREMSGASERR